MNDIENLIKTIDSWNFVPTKIFMTQNDWNDILNIKYYYICY